MKTVRQKFLYSLVALFLANCAFAQMITQADTLYGNEWINYQQIYHKIKIGADGIYRLDYATLQAAGVFSGTATPNGAQLQLFNLGKEIPIYVSNDGILGNSDYIEFYGQKNRGTIDQYLYEDTTYQLNPLYSLFSDTSIYYLTWTNTTNNLRINAISNNLTNLPEKEPFCWHTIIENYHSLYSEGQTYASVSDVAAKYDLGEGYATPFVGSKTIAISTNQFYNLGSGVQLKVRLMSDSGNHHTSIKVNGTNYIDDIYNGWAVKAYDTTIPITNWSNTNQIQIQGLASTSDKYKISNVILKYPRNFDFENVSYFEFEVAGTNQSQYLEITNFNHNGQTPILYDLSNNSRITTQVSNDTIKVVLPAQTSSRKLILMRPDEIKTISSIQATTFTDFSTLSGDYMILSHPVLFDDGNGTNYVQNYADYRSSPQGGNYNGTVVDILQVYEQFGYGIAHHQQAIRNFAHWSIKNWNAQFLFIIGKGKIHTQTRHEGINEDELDLVPTFGFPASDNLLVSDNVSNIPKIPIGRLGAYTPDMVRQYLEKVQDLEFNQQNTGQTIQDKAWMKNILHLGGGDANIQTFIKDGLDEMRDTAANGTFGANMFSLYKNSTNVIQSANSNDVIEFIDRGTSLITFFGHSAPNTLDFDIGEPNQYQNQGKYPIMYVMGCNTNRIFSVRSTLSEKYVFVEDKGVVGFIGSTATTSLGNLNIYGKIFYQKFSNELYGATIGEILKATIEDYPLTGFWGKLVQNNILLHGDPALRLSPHETPDYLVNKTETKIEPAFVNVQSDSFQLDLVITNIGRAINDSLTVHIEQEFPNGGRQLMKNLRLPSPKYQLAYTIFIPIPNKNILGENKLHITLDPENAITELPSMAESNNQTSFSFSVVSNNAFPVYPKEFSIVGERENIILKASSANAFANSIAYHMEIDTSSLFNSPIKQTSILQSTGGLITWKPTSNFQDSTIYYWRISIDSAETNGNGYDWKTSSFTFINGSSKGWNQGDFPQFVKKGLYDDILKESTMKFDTLSKEVMVQSSSFFTLGSIEVALFDESFVEFTAWPCDNSIYYTHRWEQILVAVYSPTTLERRINPFNNNISPNCWPGDLNWYIFFTVDINERQKIIDTLQSIPDDSYVILFTTQRENKTYHADQWGSDSLTLGTNLFQVLEAQGATKVRDLANRQTPYVLMYQKGNRNWSGFREVHATNIDDILNIRTILEGLKGEGTITSPPIGPTLSYASLHWNTTDYNPIADTISLDIIGITQDGTDTLLYEGLQAYDTTLSHIDANIYPYIKLRYHAKDAIERTPAQLDFWRVLYEPFPELALNPQSHTVFHADTLQQGEPLNFEIAVENIGEGDMDSVLVKYTITDAVNNEFVSHQRLKPLVEGDSLITTINFDTRPLQNKSLLTIDVNPDNDQPELHHFNNIGVKEFFVQADDTDPVIDVTFDGVHIMNGDIVSAKPTIVAILKDENDFIALDDTSNFRLFIHHPTGDIERFYIDGQTVVFYPADESDLEDNNKARIEFMPTFERDGTYTLRIEGKDATGNIAGQRDYAIDFEVLNTPMLSNVLNYPNPFTTATQFVFTLTGSQLPDAMNIQIMTAAGKVVREITMEELGPVRIGQNRTEFKWDGTDSFGNRLANGVYLYRVNAQVNGEDYELFNTGTGQYFRNGFGKMVLFR